MADTSIANILRMKEEMVEEEKSEDGEGDVKGTSPVAVKQGRK